MTSVSFYVNMLNLWFLMALNVALKNHSIKDNFCDIISVSGAEWSSNMREFMKMW